MPSLIRPRLNDYHDLAFTQEQVDFAIPLLDDDIPLYVDPFLLWKSPSQQDRSLHRTVVDAFDRIARAGADAGGPTEERAAAQLVALSECAEVGLGQARAKRGRRIGEATALAIVDLYRRVPQIGVRGIGHLEVLQLLVGGISRDRVSDIACSLLKSFLIDFTTDACRRHGIPTERVTVEHVFDDRTASLAAEAADLPVHPGTRQPLLLVPRRWLRRQPWINADDFAAFTEAAAAGAESGRAPDAVLNYNRDNYDAVVAYVAHKEREAADCKNDPLFTAIPVTSARRKLAQIRKLPTGKADGADGKYEDAAAQLLASLLYPQLDFAAEQSRTDTGALVRDLVFYNNRTVDFLQDIHAAYDARQLVFELKNVAAVEREHVNQINRYLGGPFGRFGVLVTRHPLPRAMLQHTVDLWSGQRKCVLALTDADLETMVAVFESKQRQPIEVLKRAYIDFSRRLPS